MYFLPWHLSHPAWFPAALQSILEPGRNLRPRTEGQNQIKTGVTWRKCPVDVAGPPWVYPARIKVCPRCLRRADATKMAGTTPTTRQKHRQRGLLTCNSDSQTGIEMKWKPPAQHHSLTLPPRWHMSNKLWLHTRMINAFKTQTARTPLDSYILPEQIYLPKHTNKVVETA